MKKTINLISLGCSKNLVDSERLLTSALSELNLNYVNEPEKADAIVINTCSFLESANSEAIETILTVFEEKKENAIIIVLGCLPARYKNETKTLIKELPEVNAFIQPEEYNNFLDILNKLLNLNLPLESSNWLYNKNSTFQKRLSSSPQHLAFLKIAEGCNNNCSYCLIPQIRGPLHSYTQKALIEEAKNLAQSGVLELNIIAQDITAYGRDLNFEKYNLLSLVEEISEINSLKWLRLLYAYPNYLTKEFIKKISQIPKVLPYLDVPLQHSEADILKKMGRSTKILPLETIETLKTYWPKVSLRSTLIVGFPGETEEHFQGLLNFVSKAQLDNLGVFTYSQEDGSEAALFKNQVPEEIKEARKNEVLKLQKEISLKKNQSKIGQTFEILVEDYSPESDYLVVGRAFFQATEVDGLIYFEEEQPPIGKFVTGQIIEAGHYDLIAKVL